ncbi:MAG TPA: biotin--[acetyl-CoA-carboxylase] ligase [Verrucomicrobiae bacterium]|nr:biotin--[acetyl-CoA-carboxylase] ligase [Verrucomicrobiae bacterium]
MNLSSARFDAGRKSAVAGWTVLEFEQVDSTNLVAATLPPWTAVRAETQTAGRGRFQRSWVSNEGGLWLSAVVPAPNPHSRELLPLAAGLAAIETLRGLGVKHARLRWPNDVMIGEQKLAGLLIDTFQPGTAVVGLGVNVRNQPAVIETTLASTAARLADLIDPCPSLSTLTEALLQSIREVVQPLQKSRLTELCPRINALWDRSRPVKLDLDGVEVTGSFCGVDECGRLLFSDASRHIHSFAPHQVRSLREISS